MALRIQTLVCFSFGIGGGLCFDGNILLRLLAGSSRGLLCLYRSGENHKQCSGVVLHASLDTVVNHIHKVDPVLFILSGHACISLIGDVVECLIERESARVSLLFSRTKRANPKSSIIIEDIMRSDFPHLLEKIEINTVSLLFSNKEVTLFETSGDSCDVHWGRFLDFLFKGRRARHEKYKFSLFDGKCKRLDKLRLFSDFGSLMVSLWSYRWYRYDGRAG